MHTEQGNSSSTLKPEPDQLVGRVIQSTGRRCRVQTPDKAIYECAIRGKFRIQGLKSTNPVAVGDQVRIQTPTTSGELCLVIEVLPRKNYISRKAIAQQHKEHILCANIDQALLIFTIDQPVTSYGFADRFLLLTTTFDIPTKILVNKVDLLTTEASKDKLKEVQATYTQVGFEVVALSANDPAYRELALSLLKDQISFVGGHSGVGKSSLINLVEGTLALKTKEISDYSNKGKHTTTFAEMYPLEVGGFIIDSPGIKELGIANFSKEEASHNFPEFFERLEDCKFHNCLHLNEPGCAVKAALAEESIPKSRYQSYLSILEDIEGIHLK
ncbi:MAG: ribosome small subunit-dependent GTPase A [Bacteroidota bacterium]